MKADTVAATAEVASETSLLTRLFNDAEVLDVLEIDLPMERSWVADVFAEEFKDFPIWRINDTLVEAAAESTWSATFTTPGVADIADDALKLLAALRDMVATGP